MIDKRRANPDLLQVLPEWMHAIRRPLRARHPLVHDPREHRRGALHRRALHVVQHAADATHLLTATRTPRPAVNEMGERRPVARGLLRARSVDDHHAAVVRRHAEYDLTGDVLIGREERADETPLPELRELDGL